MKGHEHAHEAMFIERLRNAQLGPFLEDQRSQAGLGSLNEQLSAVKRFIMEKLVPPYPGGPSMLNEEDRIHTDVPACIFDWSAPYVGR